MIEHELEILNQAIDDSGEVAIELAKVHEALDTLSTDDIKSALAAIIVRVDNVADVLTALSIDLAKVNNELLERRSNGNSKGSEITPE
jgi:hypothetical protein